MDENLYQKGGGVRRLMANAIRNFYFFLRLPLAAELWFVK